MPVTQVVGVCTAAVPAACLGMSHTAVISAEEGSALATSGFSSLRCIMGTLATANEAATAQMIPTTPAAGSA